MLNLMTLICFFSHFLCVKILKQAPAGDKTNFYGMHRVSYCVYFEILLIISNIVCISNIPHSIKI